MQQLNIYKKVKKEKNTMEKETVKMRASIFDPYESEVRKYISIGVSKMSTYRIVSEKLPIKPSYDGFRKWLGKRGIG